jgi:raffinose/stachyose/melibiose transport system permease protein
MFYSSFKSNEEIMQNIYSFPHDLFDNYNDKYVVIDPKSNLNIIIPYNLEKDKRERLVVESTTIAPKRGFMVFFLLKKQLPEEIANLNFGERFKVSQLPSSIRLKIYWRTIWINYTSSFIKSGGSLGPRFINSIIYCCSATFFIVILSLMIGFALSKLGFKKISAFISSLFGLGFLISINSVIIPLFLTLKTLKLTDTHIGMILVYTGFGLPMSVMLSSQFIKGLPESLIESAYIDGATTLRVFISIIIPMSMPVAVTISIINGMGIWNEFLLVLILASSEFTKSLPVGIYSFTHLSGSYLGWQLAAMVIAFLPAMIFYFIFNNRITKCAITGAIKA